jgi:hypothetical protein
MQGNPTYKNGDLTCPNGITLPSHKEGNSVFYLIHDPKEKSSTFGQHFHYIPIEEAVFHFQNYHSVHQYTYLRVLARNPEMSITTFGQRFRYIPIE